MPEPVDLNAILQLLQQSDGQLAKLFGGSPPPETAGKAEALKAKLPQILAKAEENLKKGLQIKADQENYLKRLRGEEVASDKEKEGDLDTVPSRFEAEHGPAPECVEVLVQSLLGLVDPELARKVRGDKPGGPGARRTGDLDPDIRGYLKRLGLWG